MSYKLLSEPIRKYIRDKHWKSLRRIQAAAIEKIITTDNNYILASRTASGKTEAAFLPILSKADFNQAGVQVLYISPLIALINDQFFRIADLCKDLEIKITKWHGEAKKSLKIRLIKNPNGMVLITPESLEAMFVNAPYNVSTLFGNLKYIVIDELHSFLGTDRGLQLMSLLSRIQQVNKSQITTIGLSATIGDENYMEAKRLTGNISKTKVLLDRAKKETEAQFKYFKNVTAELPLNLLKDLYRETRLNKTLIFPNSRGRAEEIAVKLRKISDKANGHKYYYSHHSSVDKEIREHIEHFVKSDERFNFCISCTSTLELGIDIGMVDKIVQIDSTRSVSSFVQRIGRSGRREGEKSVVTIYATDKWSLLQSLACWVLYKKGFVESIKTAEKHYDILLHQLLSIVKQLSGCFKADLIKRLKMNFAFQTIEEQELSTIIDEAIQSDYLEIVQREVILGIEGENIVNSREFYSVFKPESNFKVIFSGKKIGDIPLSTQVKIDENIFLAAKIWKIKDIHAKGRKISVIPAKDGKKPRFYGEGGNIHPRIREEMLRILKSDESFSELDSNTNSALEELRFDFKGFQIDDFEYDKPTINKGDKILIYTFTGTRVNESLRFLINLTGHKEASLHDRGNSLELYINISDFKELVEKVNKAYDEIDDHLKLAVEENESLWRLHLPKWGSYLSTRYKCEILKERYFDFETAIDLINNIKLVEREKINHLSD